MKCLSYVQAMATADSQAKWLMQAWLFYDNQEFWKPPQIKVHTARLRIPAPLNSPACPAGSATYLPRLFRTDVSLL